MIRVLLGYYYRIHSEINFFFLTELSGALHQEENTLCRITVDGVYPSLVVNDIQGDGCMQHHSKKYLWQLFHVEK